VNSSINFLGVIGSFLSIKSVLSDKNWLFWLLFSVRIVEVSAKVYWDVAEDAALFSGGTAVRQYRANKGKWQYPFMHLCKRPSFLPLPVLLVFLVYNFLSRWLWLVGALLSQNEFVKGYLYQTLAALNEVFRRFFWALMRLDNQQATNCENYLATRYVPILIDNGENTQQIQQKIQRRPEIDTNDLQAVAENENNILSFVRPKAGSNVKLNSSIVERQSIKNLTN